MNVDNLSGLGQLLTGIGAVGTLLLALVAVVLQSRRSRDQGRQLREIGHAVNNVPDEVTGEPGPPLWQRIDALHDLVVIHIADQAAHHHEQVPGAAA